MREPLRLGLQAMHRTTPSTVDAFLRRAARGTSLDDWEPPTWLYPYQADAARRIAGSLAVFQGALLADAVGLGKTYVSLAMAGRYRRTLAVVPASLLSQWERIAGRLETPITLLSHESLSRGRRMPACDLVIVDEAHRFRNPRTRRYDRLARDTHASHLLLVTATPVVNCPEDLLHLLRLFLADNALAPFGVPSIERALEAQDHWSLARACAPLVVARSLHVLANTGIRLPRPSDGRIQRFAPVTTPELGHLVTAIDQLRFPGMVDARGKLLLRAHLLHRLSSSTDACRETLRRHLVYLDRAWAALARGEALPRSLARNVFGPGDDLQFEMGLFMPPSDLPVPDSVGVDEERARLFALLDRLPAGSHENPKADDLARILRSRAGHRTIVFVAAVATGLDLARRLGWKHVAVVGGGRAWVASGKISVDAVLDLFAPGARRAAEPSRRTAVTTLIATDLVSEGLDLQDADAIVHYDLPWTPVRLAQRLGRIARLGSAHASAQVHWFLPPQRLEARLRTAHRLATKASHQLRLGVPVTSAVGRARVVNTILECRELLAGNSPSPAPRCGPAVPIAVVEGPPALFVAVRWHLARGICRELMVFRGYPPVAVGDYREALSLYPQLPPARLSRPSPSSWASCRQPLRSPFP